LPTGEIAPLVARGGRLLVIGAALPAHPELAAEDWGLPGVHVFTRR